MNETASVDPQPSSKENQTLSSMIYLKRSIFGDGVTKGTSDLELFRIQTALEQDQKIWAKLNTSFREIIDYHLYDVLDEREESEKLRDVLTVRCERTRKMARETQDYGWLKKYVRLKAKVALIEIILSDDVAVLVENLSDED